MRELFDWWLRQLGGMLRPILRKLTSERNATILRVDGAHAALFERRRGATRLVAEGLASNDGLGDMARRIAAERRLQQSVVVAVPTGMALLKRIKLPLAARNRIENLLRFEMDRETPFDLQEIFWSYRVHSQNPSLGQMEVDLVVIPRERIWPVLAAVRAAGLNPTAMETPLANGMFVTVPVAEASEQRAARALWATAALAGAAAILGIVTVAIPFVRQEQAIAAADRTIAALTADAQKAAAARQSLDRLAEAERLLQTQRTEAGGVLSTLALVTQSLPDDTHLTSLTLHGDRLVLTGLARSAAGLVSTLSQTPGFRAADFASPVLRSKDSDLEMFTIGATLAATKS